MAPDNNEKRSNHIPIKFVDSEEENDSQNDDPADMESEEEANSFVDEPEPQAVRDVIDEDPAGRVGGPVTAELVATRAELKRVQEENNDLKDRRARRQADFENYRKRVDRERSETYNRVVADVAGKLLGVLDNLKRALESEAYVEASESDEFRHFLSGVDLIYKQLSGVLEALGVKQIIAVGEPFNPHIHEAVITEATDEVEPDTVIQEIRAGYRLGDKLIRPALVKVATRS